MVPKPQSFCELNKASISCYHIIGKELIFYIYHIIVPFLEVAARASFARQVGKIK